MPNPPESQPEAATNEAPSDPTERAATRLSPYLKILRRMIRTLTGLFQAHVIVIRTEAEKEAIRVASGLALVFGAAAFVGVTALLAGIALVGLIQRVSGLPWLESLGLAMVGTASVALSLLTVAWLLLRRPLLPKSRALLKSTFDALTGA